MFYAPEPQRGWHVHSIFTGDHLVVETLKDMQKDPEAPGFSDVGIRNLIYCFAVNLKPRRVLEIGTHIGTCAVVIGSALRLNQYGRLITLEPAEHYRKIALKYIQRAQLSDFIQVEPSFSSDPGCQDFLRREGPFELIFIDGAHDYVAAKNDIELCRDLVAENGMIVLHDVGIASPDMDPSGRGGVRSALHDFSKEHPEFRVMYFEYPLWLNPCGAAVICRQKLDPPVQSGLL